MQMMGVHCPAFFFFCSFIFAPRSLFSFLSLSSFLFAFYAQKKGTTSSRKHCFFLHSLSLSLFASLFHCPFFSLFRYHPLSPSLSLPLPLHLSPSVRVCRSVTIHTGKPVPLTFSTIITNEVRDTPSQRASRNHLQLPHVLFSPSLL